MMTYECGKSHGHRRHHRPGKGSPCPRLLLSFRQAVNLAAASLRPSPRKEGEANVLAVIH